jgi:hypothetical protein
MNRKEKTVRVDLAQLAQWAHEGIRGETRGSRNLAIANLLSAATRMSLALEAIEANEPLALPAGLAGLTGVIPGSVLTVVRDHCCEDAECSCHRRAAP